MRMLLPTAVDDLSDSDLDSVYAWPGDPERLPWLRANMVATVDGAARAPDGLSGGISSEADQRVFGRLRGLADVVLAGAGTVRHEVYKPGRVRPEFLARRRAAGQTDVPVIAVVSRSLELDLGMDLFARPTGRVVVITHGRSDPGRRAHVSEVAEVLVAGDVDVNLQDALDQLRQQGLVRIHAEGGPRLLSDLAAADLLDELLLSVTPMLAGGSYGNGPTIPRILGGDPLPDPPRGLSLHHLLEEDGALFLSYRRG
jgi:riboflavin biosynthesis pyrimidine reductase